MTRERKLAIKMWEEIVEKLKKGDELFNAVRLQTARKYEDDWI